jgi:hypothetical protein
MRLLHGREFPVKNNSQTTDFKNTDRFAFAAVLVGPQEAKANTKQGAKERRRS